MQKSYSEQRQDPQWQRKRLEVFDSANFRCQLCGNDRETLHAHHSYYTKGANCWDYPPGAIICLCETCHAKHHGINDEPAPDAPSRDTILAAALPFIVESDRELWEICRRTTAELTAALALMPKAGDDALPYCEASIWPIAARRTEACDRMTQESRRLLCNLLTAA